MYCCYCGQRLREGSRYCSRCGAAVRPSPTGAQGSAPQPDVSTQAGPTGGDPARGTETHGPLDEASRPIHGRAAGRGAAASGSLPVAAFAIPAFAHPFAVCAGIAAVAFVGTLAVTSLGGAVHTSSEDVIPPAEVLTQDVVQDTRDGTQDSEPSEDADDATGDAFVASAPENSPQETQQEQDGQGEQGDEESWLVEGTHLSFELPEYWRGRVRVSMLPSESSHDLDCIDITSMGGSHLATVQYFPSGTSDDGGDVGNFAAYTIYGESGFAQVHVTNWPYLASLGQAEAAGASPTELADLVDLVSGGSYSMSRLPDYMDGSSVVTISSFIESSFSPTLNFTDGDHIVSARSAA